jgi:hypothetical protein
MKAAQHPALATALQLAEATVRQHLAGLHLRIVLHAQPPRAQPAPAAITHALKSAPPPLLPAHRSPGRTTARHAPRPDLPQPEQQPTVLATIVHGTLPRVKIGVHRVRPIRDLKLTFALPPSVRRIAPHRAQLSTPAIQISAGAVKRHAAVHLEIAPAATVPVRTIVATVRRHLAQTPHALKVPVQTPRAITNHAPQVLVKPGTTVAANRSAVNQVARGRPKRRVPRSVPVTATAHDPSALYLLAKSAPEPHGRGGVCRLA